MVGMSEQRGGEGGADWGFRWVQLHARVKSPCPTFASRPKGVTPTSPTLSHSSLSTEHVFAHPWQ